MIITSFSTVPPEGEIVFYEFRPGIDGELYKNIKAQLPKVTFIPFDILWIDGLAFSAKDYFISTRFHLQLIVASMGLKGMFFYWNEYYRNKFSILNDVTNWKALNLDDQAQYDVEISLDDIANNELTYRYDFERVRNEKFKMANDIYPPE